jgi:flagellar basal-body rod protein FlgF
MIRGLYISATQLNANQKLLDAIGNNIANVDSTGFKKDEIQQESFNDILLTKYNGSKTNYDPPFAGITVQQDGPKDYSLTTKGGFFRIQNESGTSYNKAVKFSVDEKGYLSTYYYNSDKTKDVGLGDKVLGQNGPIFVGTQDYKITEQGQVQVAGQTVDQLVYLAPKDVIGTMGSGIKSTRLVTDFTQGTITPAGGPLDFALKGDGFVEVKTPFGMRYTRNGAFDLNEQKQLVTSEGYLVQGFKGDITLADDKIIVNEFGEITAGSQIVDKLKIVNFTNKGDLRKIGGSFYDYSTEPKGKQVPFEGQVVQGSIEQSNVDAITEMIKMINVQRDYESGQKLIRTFDETLTKAVTEVGMVR